MAILNVSFLTNYFLHLVFITVDKTLYCFHWSIYQGVYNIDNANFPTYYSLIFTIETKIKRKNWNGMSNKQYGGEKGIYF